MAPLLGGSGGMLPGKFFDKNGVMWGVPNYVITNLKINNYKGEKTKKISCHISLSDRYRSC